MSKRNPPSTDGHIREQAFDSIAVQHRDRSTAPRNLSANGRRAAPCMANLSARFYLAMRRTFFTNMNHGFRNDWLLGCVCAFIPTVSQIGEFPAVCIRCDWPSRATAVGEIWPPSDDGRYQIYIAPSLNDEIQIAATVLHEMVHAVVGLEHGHRGPFQRAMRVVGLVGKPRISEAGETLRTFICRELFPILGPYPAE